MNGNIEDTEGEVKPLVMKTMMSTTSNGRDEAAANDGVGTRFGGLTANVEASVRSVSMGATMVAMNAPFSVTAMDLSAFGAERTRVALADLLEIGIKKEEDHAASKKTDVETPSAHKVMQTDVQKLVTEMRAAGNGKEEADPESSDDKSADMAANVLTSVLLRSSPESGIDPREVEHRREIFGTNALTEKPMESYCKLCFEAVQDFVLLMLIVLGSISVAVEVSLHPGDCATCWVEGAAILISVIIVVNVTAGIDYWKQFQFQSLSRSLHDTNTKQVIRDGQQVSVIDDDIVVGDILSVNSHNLASIPADCVLLGPASDLKMNESSLTGESKLISKRPGDVILSGTNAAGGSGKMVVIAVGVHSVAGKIKAQVYESADHKSELEGEDTMSPLYVKLDWIAKRIGLGGALAALFALFGSCLVGYGFRTKDFGTTIIEYIITSITVLAVAVPEGLPLAVTLSLAFSSNKMMKEKNLVKHLDACETMGCATTICTDKTGTLTANKMSARSLFVGHTNYVVDDAAMTLGAYVKKAGILDVVVNLLCSSIAVNTMDETTLSYSEGKMKVTGGSGNPTEVALLHLTHDLGQSYQNIRNTTKGRSGQGAMGKFLAMGKRFEFSSARKMMSWAVPKEDGGYRLYCKGASEVVLARCSMTMTKNGSEEKFTEEMRGEAMDVSLAYARRGMRCLALAYRDLPEGFDLDSKSATVNNSDGTDANEAEIGLTVVALVGIEDPIREEVKGAIAKCYQAGIDVRLVTGDNQNTAVSIAYQAGILRNDHFIADTTEFVTDNLKQNVMMEGKDFRAAVYRVDSEGKKEFDQMNFDKIWPHLRVLARSSPDDKLTLAHGLNQSNLFADKEACAKLLREDNIKIFPDRQVVAMTGDGTNDAPALKRADIGFAMGVAGTQIAKDAADIILLDDNFASIVTAAKWGRNVFASIQKFLQFQLTVNISAVFTALVGAWVHQKSPLAAIQLLWVNLLMDSLASLALASEPPVAELLQKPPVNRSDSMITKHMFANMGGHALFQIIVVLTILFYGPQLFDVPSGYGKDDDNTIHYTIIFNTFVWMQLFNEINCRKLKGELNVFQGILDNNLFCGIWIVTAFLQAIIVQYGYLAFHVAEGGLNWQQWLISMGIGSLELIVQQIINLFFRLGQHVNIDRNQTRSRKDAQLSTQRLTSSEYPQNA